MILLILTIIAQICYNTSKWGCKIKNKSGEKGGFMVFEIKLFFGLIKVKIIHFQRSG